MTENDVAGTATNENENTGVAAPSVPMNAFQDISIEHTEENSLKGPVVNSSMTTLPEQNIIHRKLSSYVGFANLPQQWQKKSIKQGFTLNLMVVGEGGLGKSTLVNTLFNTTLYDVENNQPRDPSTIETPITVTTNSVSAEIEEGGVRLTLTVIDCPGFGDAINNSEAWRPIVQDIDRRFDQYLEEETKINRTSIRDERIHACIYFIQPTGHSLKSLDIDVMLRLHKKVNLVPVIAKSDTLTAEEVEEFKQRILDDIRFHKIEIFQPPLYENDDEEAKSETFEINKCIPFAIVGSMEEIGRADGTKVRGREYPWGIIEIDNEDHCDFVKLRQLIIRNHLEELRERTANVLYENYRTRKLEESGIVQDSSVFREVNPTIKMEEDRMYHKQRLQKMEQDMKAVFQQKVHEKEQKLKQSEADLFTRHRQMKESLAQQKAELENKKEKLEQMRLAGEDKKRKIFMR